jgi:hypothetical protein
MKTKHAIFMYRLFRCFGSSRVASLIKLIRLQITGRTPVR